MKRQAVKKLIQCVAIIAAGVLAIILFMLAIWYRGKNSEPVTDEQVAAQMQQAEPLVIETPEAAAEGSIRVYDYDGCCIYAYYGKIQINNDGKDGKDIDVEAIDHAVLKTEIRTIKKCESGKITKEQLQKSIQSWTGHAGHADSYNLRKKIETLAEAAIEKAA